MFKTIFALALLCANAQASQINCVFASCGFGSLQQTVTNSFTIQPSGGFEEFTESTTTNVYKLGSVFAYEYIFTLSSPAALKLTGYIVIAPIGAGNYFGATIMSFGSVTDKASPNVTDCSTSAGAGCTSDSVGINFDTIHTNQGFQIFSDGIGVGISAPLSTSTTFDFYITSLGTPTGAISGFAASGGGGGAPRVLVPAAGPAIPEPGTLLAAPLALLFMGLRSRLRSR